MESSHMLTFLALFRLHPSSGIPFPNPSLSHIPYLIYHPPLSLLILSPSHSFLSLILPFILSFLFPFCYPVLSPPFALSFPLLCSHPFFSCILSFFLLLLPYPFLSCFSILTLPAILSFPSSFLPFLLLLFYLSPPVFLPFLSLLFYSIFPLLLSCRFPSCSTFFVPPVVSYFLVPLSFLLLSSYPFRPFLQLFLAPSFLLFLTHYFSLVSFRTFILSYVHSANPRTKSPHHYYTTIPPP
jgi:hypothetical protein